MPDEPVYRDDDPVCLHVVNSLIASAEPPRRKSRIYELIAETKQRDEENLIPSDPKNAAMYYALQGVSTAHIGATDLYCVDVAHCRKLDLQYHHWYQVATRLECEKEVFRVGMQHNFDRVHKLEEQIEGYKQQLSVYQEEERRPFLAVICMGFVAALFVLAIKVLRAQ